MKMPRLWLSWHILYLFITFIPLLNFAAAQNLPGGTGVRGNQDINPGQEAGQIYSGTGTNPNYGGTFFCYFILIIISFILLSSRQRRFNVSLEIRNA